MQNTTLSVSRGDKSGVRFPDRDAVIQALELPDGWSTNEDTSERDVADYSVIATLESNDEVQGWLLSDEEYLRIACVLLPVDEAFRKHSIAATQSLTTDAQVEEWLSPVEAEIQNRDGKL